MAKRKNTSQTPPVAKKKKQKKKGTLLYPKHSLRSALRLAESIRDSNAGQPYNRIDLADSIGISPESSTYRLLITASSKFWLTQGGYQAEKIGLTELGRRIVSPMSDEESSSGLLEALYKVEFYKKFFERFRNHKLPRKGLLLNTLEREFSIPFDIREQCYELLIKNANELGLLKERGGTLYVRFDVPSIGEEVLQGEDTLREDAETKEEEISEEISKTPEQGSQEEKPIPDGTFVEHKPVVFISHSKNTRILSQIKSNLEFGGFKYKIAVETETTAIPIPEKVFGMMRECNCAIINMSADEQERKEDGTYSVNANVLTEIGAAFLAYNQRVILLIDKRIKRPSNLDGLYRCEYEGDQLSSEAVTKLQKSLLAFRVPVD